MNDVKPAPGAYEGKIVVYGIKKTQQDQPAPTIKFKVNDGEADHYVYWQGSFKEGKAREIALKALITCGLRDPKDLARLADGVESGVLDVNKAVEVAIIHEPSSDGSKIYPRVQWINEIGGSGFHNAISSGEAAMLMRGMGLEADLMALVKQHGFASSQTSKSVQKPVGSDYVPF